MSKGGIDVVIEDLQTHPCCPHGPTILFTRNVKGVKRSFFACAACRDRKDCNFFLWADEKKKWTIFKRDFWETQTHNILKGINHRKMYVFLNKIKSVTPENRIYCHSCSQFQIGNFEEKHLNHKLLRGITDYQLSHPTEILLPLEDSKKEAQYLFSKSSVQTIVKIFKKIGYKYVICIGTPRIHEYIQNNCKDFMSSILLDIDKRFHNFFGPLEFCWYNSFNHHFFFKEAKCVFEDFLAVNNGNNMVLVTDPPFGGRIETLALTLETINAQYKSANCVQEDMPIFWIFPYFMESQILNSLPNFKMLDYKVDYDNHPLFQDGAKGRKQGSPVRMFTNIDPSLIKLPKTDYNYCKACQRWVSKENNHCYICNLCTSKDGRTYVHCTTCQRCVKPTWKHCNKCNRCAQVDHKCTSLAFSKECFYCKEMNHKKNECPKLNDMDMKNKRKKEAKKSDMKRKRK